jgi:hypothetical protein
MPTLLSDVICRRSIGFILIFYRFWIQMNWRKTFRHAATIKLTSWTFNLANWQPCSRRLQWVPGSSWVHLPQIIFINMMPVAYSRTTSWLWSDYTFFQFGLCVRRGSSNDYTFFAIMMYDFWIGCEQGGCKVIYMISRLGLTDPYLLQKNIQKKKTHRHSKLLLLPLLKVWYFK